MVRFPTILLLLQISGSSILADEKSAELLNVIQGEWQRTVERDGEVVLVVKTIGRKHETVSYYVSQQVVYAHRVNFTVRTTAQGNVFSYEGKTITAGPDAGKSISEKGSYLFKVDDDTWYEIHRMMPGESGAPWITTYKRAGNDSAEEP